MFLFGFFTTIFFGILSSYATYWFSNRRCLLKVMQKNSSFTFSASPCSLRLHLSICLRCEIQFNWLLFRVRNLKIIIISHLVVFFWFFGFLPSLSWIRVFNSSFCLLYGQPISPISMFSFYFVWIFYISTRIVKFTKTTILNL